MALFVVEVALDMIHPFDERASTECASGTLGYLEAES